MDADDDKPRARRSLNPFKPATRLEYIGGPVVAVWFLVCGAMVIAGLITQPRGPVQPWMWAWFFGGGAAMLGFIVFARRRGRQFVAARDYLVCPHCVYLMQGIADGAPCPECGFTFTHAEMRDHWKAWYSTDWQERI